MKAATKAEVVSAARRQTSKELMPSRGITASGAPRSKPAAPAKT